MDNFSNSQTVRKQVVATRGGVVAAQHRRAAEVGAAGRHQLSQVPQVLGECGVGHALWQTGVQVTVSASPEINSNEKIAVPPGITCAQAANSSSTNARPNATPAAASATVIRTTR